MSQHESEAYERHESWAVQAGAEKILAAEDMRDYAIFSLEPDGTVASWNIGAARLNGYTSNEVIGRHFSLFYLPEQAASGYPDWKLKSAAEDGFFIDRGWRVRKDGSHFWAHVVITVQRSPEGALDGFVIVVRNESESEARRERTKRRFTDLFELAPSAIGLLDDSGRFLDANGALCDLLGYRLAELRQRTIRDMLHPFDTGDDPVATTPFASEKQPIPHRILRRHDGTLLHCQIVSAASVRDDGTRSWLVMLYDVTEQIRQAEMLRHQATHDQLTGLLNRRGFEERMASLLPPNKPGRVGLVYGDMNNFKRVNDALGHESGDQLLLYVAQRLVTEMPNQCEAARFYGDEFAIICSGLENPEELTTLTQQIRGLFQMTVPLANRQVQVTASVGSAAASSETTVSDLLRLAESAMLDDRNKGQGLGKDNRERALVSDTDHDQLELEELLREAIQHDRLDLHYQPVIANDGSVTIAEALLRWQHPDTGLLKPDVVLKVARGGGMMAELDGSVLRSALRDAAHWRQPHGAPVRVSVNLSGLGPEHPDFVDVVRSAIEDAGIDAHNVVLEMVETVLAQLEPQSRHAMTQLISDGVQFAVDDFGTGYSSLARLKEMPTQIVKLDRGFISGVGVDPDDLGVARAVTELARTMGRLCVAEGVETATQHHLLRAIAVDAYQGYFFSPPLPPDQFRSYLASSPAMHR